MLNIITVSIASVFLFLALIVSIRIWSTVPVTNVRIWWAILMVLTLFFLSAYAVFIAHEIFGIDIGPIHTLNTQIFLWGAVFVFITFKIFQTTLNITAKAIEKEEEYKQCEEWFKTFDAISDLVFIQDKHFTITRVNRAFAAALKAKPEDIIGKKCYELLHKRTSPWPDCPFAKAKDDRKSHTEEVDDHNIGIPMIITASPIFDKYGEVTGSVHVAKDITEIRKKEELVKQKMDKIEAMNKIMVDRELRILEMKREINALLNELGRGDKYLK